MSYQINKTDGTLLTDLVDGQIDQNSTNLTLVGKNYTGYGEYFNENFVKLLENFANTAAPSNPISGQLWWDTSEQRLKVFDGTVWKASGGPYVQDSRPQMVAGDMWIDNLNDQVYAYDGTDTILIGPDYTKTQGVSGFQIGSILDSQSRSRTVAYLYIGGTMVGLFSNIEFTPIYSQRIDGLVTATNPNGVIYQGFNIIDKTNFKYRGIADSANALVTDAGVVRKADSFLPSNANGITTGTLTIQNSGGLTIGLSQNNVQKVVGPRFYIENQLTDHDISMRVSSSNFGALTVDAIYVDASTARVGIFNVDRLPEYTLDVEGDLRVTGNLLVEGDTTSIDVATLRVEDKNIEIAKTADGTVLAGADADGAGLTLETSDVGTKTWTWTNSEDAWTSNVNIDLSDDTKTYQIGGEDKLTDTSLTNVQKALDLDELGTLLYLNIDSISIDGTIIKSGSLTSLGDASDNPQELNIIGTDGINITGSGPITITDNQLITGLAKTDADTGDPTDAASKAYVDEQTSLAPVVFSMDVTALGTGTTLRNNVAAFLNDMYPAAPANDGKDARIHTTSYSGATVSGIDVEGIKNISYIAVDSNGTQNESVVQDVSFDAAGAAGSATLTPIRTLMEFRSDGSNWNHVQTTPY